MAKKFLLLKCLGVLGLVACLIAYFKFDAFRRPTTVKLTSVAIFTDERGPGAQSADIAPQISHSKLDYAAIAPRKVDSAVSNLKEGAPLPLLTEHVDAAAAAPAEPAEPDSAFRERVEAMQKIRQARLQEVCGNGSNVKTDSMGTVFNFQSLGLTYCCIAKCASTTFKMFLDNVNGNPCRDRDIHSCAFARFTRSKSREDFMENSLVIVRNPWKRLVSSYTNKFIDERYGKIAQPCYALHGKSDGSKGLLTFPEFVECILHNVRAGQELEFHVAPVTWHCSPCQNKFSYIATLETFSDDLNYLFRYVLPKTKSLDEYWAAVSTVPRRQSEVANKTRLNYLAHYKSLTKDQMDSLVAIYRTDALMYGYPLHPLESEN